MQTEPLKDSDLSLAEIMRRWPQTKTVFFAHRMLCVGCWISPIHTLDDACAEYHLDRTAFRHELERAITADPGSRPEPPADAAG